MARERKKWSHKEVQELIHEDDVLVTELRKLQLWLQRNWVSLVVTVVVAVVVVAAVAGYRAYTSGRERDAAVALTTARKEFTENNLDKVTTTCQDILLSYPNTQAYEAAMVLLGDAYLRGENLESAEKTYREYLASFPNGLLVPQVRRNLALIYQARGEHPKAIEEYKQLLAAGLPGIASDELRFYLGQCYEAGGQTSEAARVYNEIGKGSAWRPEIERRLEWLKVEPAQPLAAS